MHNILLKKKHLTILLFFISFFCFSQEILIKPGATWNYFDQGYLSENWFLNVNTTQWKTGNAPIGYGDSQAITEISFGGDEENKELVEYFKKEITINKNYIGFEFKLLRDDGAIVYVNGKELYRSNMQNTTLTKNSTAMETISGKEEHTYHSNVFDNSIFKQGKNTIAIAVYQAYSDSSDLIFDLELVGHSSSKVLEEIVNSKDEKNVKLKYELKALDNNFKLEKVKNENAILQYSNSTLKVFLFIISILFIICLFGIYYLIENQKKKVTALNTKINEIHKKSFEKEKEMMYLSTKLLNNKQYFKELKTEIKALETTDKKNQKHIISEIDSILENDEEWDFLKKHFSTVYSGFYDKLLLEHPELSESDLRHCMFIKLHMQTKEIAKILLIDPRSVQTTRYRIKKKMNLDEDQDLKEYLLSI